MTAIDSSGYGLESIWAAYACNGVSEGWAVVWIDSGAGFALPDDHVLSQRHKEIDQLVLGNLLLINLHRAGEE